MSDEKKIKVTISKNYERKVNLSGISSQYDNITSGSFISMDVEIDKIEDAVDKMRELEKIVFNETERDVKERFIRLKEMADDEKNQMLMGIGNTLEITKDEASAVEKKKEIKAPKSKTKTKQDSSKAKTIDDLLMDVEDGEEEEPIKNQKVEEVDIDDFDLGDFDGGLLDD
jgi:hypothetical protein